MQATFEQISNLVTKATEIAETKVEIYKLRAAQKATLTLTSIISIMVIGMIAALVLVILSIGLALYIGPWLGDTSYGFFAVGLFYLLTGIILFFVRDKILSGPLSNFIIDKMIK
ncbi:MAG: phage holin family protein [Gloeobacteraceae cyanobacterium ES-bin-316]|nr:phage holin family protein [Ferruginibacter sp.]